MGFLGAAVDTHELWREWDCLQTSLAIPCHRAADNINPTIKPLAESGHQNLSIQRGIGPIHRGAGEPFSKGKCVSFVTCVSPSLQLSFFLGRSESCALPFTSMVWLCQCFPLLHFCCWNLVSLSKIQKRLEMPWDCSSLLHCPERGLSLWLDPCEGQVPSAPTLVAMPWARIP